MYWENEEATRCRSTPRVGCSSGAGGERASLSARASSTGGSFKKVINTAPDFLPRRICCPPLSTVTSSTIDHQSRSNLDLVSNHTPAIVSETPSSHHNNPPPPTLSPATTSSINAPPLPPPPPTAMITPTINLPLVSVLSFFKD
ncbi:hypothetical protein PCASD_00282 [Puccinia coronata f. sp. avenae]|uniref:Uncharacterized protein n=1 Tax=Puccinia coronata f. sp. avenae TaxID=200324 RepID=A0A2N5VN80_9BASI|nr:hypothetical protein PCASD_00282 [Puccinia coronata f. sp. avenae]